MLIIAALWLMVLASSSQATIVAPILPRIGEALNIPEALQGTLVTGYAIALSTFAVIIGPISDRFGRRPILLAGTSLMCVMLALHALANDFTSLLTFRIGAGVSGGVLTGVAVAYVGDYFPYERRGWANGWVMSGFAFGQVVAVPMGTILAERYGFRSPFILFSGIAAISFLLILTVIPQPQIKRSGENLSVKYVLINYLKLLKKQKILNAGLAYATMLFAVSSFTVFFPTWLERELSMSPSATATLFMVGGLANILIGPQAGRWSDKVGRKPMILASCLLSAVVFTITPFIVSGTLSAYTVFFLVMMLLALRLSPLQALLTTLVPDNQRGSLMSLVVAIGQLGGGFGGAIAGIAFARFNFLGNAILAAISITATGLIVWWGLSEPATGQRLEVKG
ncbi:MAG: MFS transporter [Cyanobacteria bacterium J06649_11]